MTSYRLLRPAFFNGSYMSAGTIVDLPDSAQPADYMVALPAVASNQSQPVVVPVSAPIPAQSVDIVIDGIDIKIMKT